ncbi:MAG: ADP-glyceromanno-heptose 6-epimerase [Alphaproteobacteria bacterium]|nr:ADP-glyceromanno-heptose 6-epimerase [Alphaproteobacteria bacterium]
MIVVTGGAGFIGSNLIAGLEARGLGEIVVCDSFGRADKWRNLAKRDLADLVAPDALADFLAANRGQVKAIFHLGANSSTTERDVDVIVRNNITLTLELWRWCAEAGVRMIYASSAATYGDGQNGFDDDGSVTALARLRPLNPYGWSKHVIDRRIARMVADGAARPPQWAGLKFFNVYGPNEYHKGEQQSVAAHVFRALAQGKPATLFRSHRPDYPDGGQRRDFVWVGDCVDVMLWLYDNPGVSGLFNMGTGAARSFADLAGAVFAAFGRSAEIAFVDTPEAIRSRYQYFTQAEMHRLRKAGYGRIFTTLEEGITRYVRDFLAHADLYR